MTVSMLSTIARLSRSIRPLAPLRHEHPFACSIAHRAFASSTGSSASPAVFISDSVDPYFNLAFEEWIFRKTDPESVILYMYRNMPSVIIGRNQNPWKEINLKNLNQLDIPFIRRKSGGGTVYHDLGNTNYCIYVPRLQFERRPNAELVSRALNDLKIPSFVNERNDICVDKFKMRSAYKLVNARAYHHGTMLIDAQLEHLKGVLGNTKDTMVTKGVASVSSAVKNLRHWSNDIDHTSFVNAVVKEFAKTYGTESSLIQRVDESELQRNDFARKISDELKSWDWMYGQTPEFTHDMSTVFPFGELACRISSRHALVTSAELVGREFEDEAWQESVEQLLESLVGDRYHTLEKATDMVERERGVYRGRLEEVLAWFKSAM